MVCIPLASQQTYLTSEWFPGLYDFINWSDTQTKKHPSLVSKKNKRLLLDFFVDRIKSALSNVCVLELEDILIN